MAFVYLEIVTLKLSVSGDCCNLLSFANYCFETRVLTGYYKNLEREFGCQKASASQA